MTITFKIISPNDACIVDVDSSSGENNFKLSKSLKNPVVRSKNLIAISTDKKTIVTIQDRDLFFCAITSNTDARSASANSKKDNLIACGNEILS